MFEDSLDTRYGQLTPILLQVCLTLHNTAMPGPLGKSSKVGTFTEALNSSGPSRASIVTATFDPQHPGQDWSRIPRAPGDTETGHDTEMVRKLFYKAACGLFIFCDQMLFEVSPLRPKWFTRGEDGNEVQPLERGTLLLLVVLRL